MTPLRRLIHLHDTGTSAAEAGRLLADEWPEFREVYAALGKLREDWQGLTDSVDDGGWIEAVEESYTDTLGAVLPAPTRVSIADLIASAIGICDDCKMAAYPEDAIERDRVSGQLWHVTCPQFPASHRPAPRAGMVERLRELGGEVGR